jgi:hypothetical protein
MALQLSLVLGFQRGQIALIGITELFLLLRELVELFARLRTELVEVLGGMADSQIRFNNTTAVRETLGVSHIIVFQRFFLLVVLFAQRAPW